MLTGGCAGLLAIYLKEEKHHQEEQPSAGGVGVFPRIQRPSAEVGRVEHPGVSTALGTRGPAGAHSSNIGDGRHF